MTSFYLAKEGRIDEIIHRIRESGLNSVVVNVKNMRGEVTYDTQVSLANKIGANTKRINLNDTIGRFEAEGIYVIVRQVVFYDPKLAFYLKLFDPHWVPPSNDIAVSYNLAIAKELVLKGVDEIQFDYIRFPDKDGIDSNFGYHERYRAINSFLKKAYTALSSKVNISADVFGRTLWEWNKKKIDPIGQNLEDIAQWVDILSPMVYPSHFNRRFWSTPYQVVNKTLKIGRERKLSLRPFIQGFNRSIPDGMTLPEYINEQIDAVRDAGIGGFLVWNPRSDYSSLWEALKLRNQ